MKTKIIEASNIQIGGGKILLLTLLNYFNLNFPDEKLIVRVKNTSVIEEIKRKNYSNIEIIKVSMLDFFFNLLKTNHNTLFFGNLPPFRKSHNSLLYIHRPFLVLPYAEYKNKSKITQLKIILNQLFLHLFSHNVSKIACQTLSMEKNIKSIYNKNAIQMPFYEFIPLKSSTKEFDFCYISFPYEHKNHALLLDTFLKIKEKKIEFTIAVTIPNSENFQSLLKKIDEINIDKKRIHNFGYADHHTIKDIYSKTKVSLFISKQETFGIPLIESVLSGLPVITPNLSYVFDVIKPSLTFNSENEFEEILIETIQKDFMIKKAELVSKNKIEDIFKLIS